MRICRCGLTSHAPLPYRRGTTWVLDQELLIALPLAVCAEFVARLGQQLPHTLASAQTAACGVIPGQPGYVAIHVQPEHGEQAAIVLETLDALGLTLDARWHSSTPAHGRRIMVRVAVPRVKGGVLRAGPTMERPEDLVRALTLAHHAATRPVSRGDG